MKKTFVLFILQLAIFSSGVRSQTTFTREFKTDQALYAGSIAAWPGGGYVFVGTRIVIPIVTPVGVLVRFDEQANIIWQKEFGAATGMQGFQIAVTPDSMIFVSAAKLAPIIQERLFTLASFDANGNSRWAQTLGVVSQADGPCFLTLAADSTVVGVTPGTDPKQMSVWKTRFDGTPVWNKMYEGVNMFTYLPSAVVACPDSSIVVFCGNQVSQVDGNDVIVVTNIDRFGAVRWKTSLASTGVVAASLTASAACPTQDGGVLLCGSSSPGGRFQDGTSLGFAARFGPGGNLAWLKTYDLFSRTTFNAVTSLSDGSFLVAGGLTNSTVAVGFDPPTDSLLTMHLSSTGGLLEDQLVSSHTRYVLASAVARTNDGGAMILAQARTSADSGVNGNWMLWLVRTDTSLSICHGTGSLCGIALAGDTSTVDITQATAADFTASTVGVSQLPPIVSTDQCATDAVPIEPMPDKIELNVRPNPSTATHAPVLTISAKQPLGECSVELLDLLGRAVWSLSIPLRESECSLPLNDTQCPAGTYVLRVQQMSEPFLHAAVKIIRQD